MNHIRERFAMMLGGFTSGSILALVVWFGLHQPYLATVGFFSAIAFTAGKAYKKEYPEEQK